jgi:glutamate-1-semialdehyde 2,1-aminomutase
MSATTDRSFPSTTAATEQLLNRADAVLSGGALGYFTLPADIDLVIREGRGAHLIDIEGREFIDYLLGSGPMLIGHANPQVLAAVEAQVKLGSTYYFLNEPAIRLSERLVDAIPCAEEVRYTSTGTEATFLALRCARAYTGRSKILKFEGGWHGMQDYGLWATVPGTPSDYPHAEPDSLGIPAVLADEVLVAPFNDIETTLRIIEEHADELAAVMIEPLQRILKPEPGFLEAVREVTNRHGIVLIFDEVVTGFRIAWGGAQELYGVVPDMATYGKAMAGGFPLAAIVGNHEIMNSFGNVRRASNTIAWASGTFSGNPIGAAAGLAALDVLEAPGAYEHLHHIGSRLRRGIEEAGRRHGFDVQALGEDAVFGVRFMKNPHPKSWADLLENDGAMGTRWAIECVRRGVLLIPNEKFYISVAHSDADVDRTLEVCDAAFAACEA